MENKHFVYTTTKEIPPIEEDKEKGIEAKEGYSVTEYHSFDVSRILRVITIADDTMLVLLDDLHERYENRPKVNPKTQRPLFDKKGELIIERVKDTFQSEIHLTKEQGMELLSLIQINKVL